MMIRIICCFCLLTGSVTASSLSIGPNGINAAVLRSPLNLTGMGIAIGQEEPGRPGMEPTDAPADLHQDVDPVAVFRYNQSPNTADAQGVDGEHAQNVAGIMISKNNGLLAGVAPAAQLYASAAPGSFEENHLRALNHVASRNGRDVRAINLSYALTTGEFSTTDGNSYITRGLDWLATAYDNTLFVVGGNEFNQPVLPQDNYNGIVVGSSGQNGDFFREVSSFNTFDGNPTQDRTAIGLIAPGEGYPLTSRGTTSTTAPHPEGTSNAAPHVTGTVALLQELGERNALNIGGPRWGSGNFREHEVSKAVLLNSADKIVGVHGSPRTVVSSDATGNYTWQQSTALTDDAQPLDIQFGAGHLNALRAVTQIGPGEWDGGDIPRIGWDFGETGGVGTDLRYTFDADLQANEWIALTLTWDREVFKTGDENSFSLGDMFTVGADNGLSNLDLFLVPEGSNDFSQAAPNVLRSVSSEQNVEHIFARVPATGSYDIVVRQVAGGPGSDLEFGLAWWFGNPFLAPLILGDFDGDGDVDGGDLNDWRMSFGPTGGADADGDGDSDGGDFLAWQRNLGAPFATPTAGAVPEPAALVLCAFGLPLLLRRHATLCRAA